MNTYRKELIFRFLRTFGLAEFLFRARGYYQYRKGNRPYACRYEKQFIYDYFVRSCDIELLGIKRSEVPLFKREWTNDEIFKIFLYKIRWKI